MILNAEFGWLVVNQIIVITNKAHSLILWIGLYKGSFHNKLHYLVTSDLMIQQIQTKNNKVFCLFLNGAR